MRTDLHTNGWKWSAGTWVWAPEPTLIRFPVFLLPHLSRSTPSQSAGWEPGWPGFLGLALAGRLSNHRPLDICRYEPLPSALPGTYQQGSWAAANSHLKLCWPRAMWGSQEWWGGPVFACWMLESRQLVISLSCWSSYASLEDNKTYLIALNENSHVQVIASVKK